MLIIVITDLGIWFGLAVVLMNYEDFYEPHHGAYYSHESMTLAQFSCYLTYILLVALHIALLLLLLYKALKVWLTKLR